jgi:hypothetical protein
MVVITGTGGSYKESENCPTLVRTHWFQFQLIRTKLDLSLIFGSKIGIIRTWFYFLQEPDQELDSQFYLGVEPELEPFLKNKSD